MAFNLKGERNIKKKNIFREEETGAGEGAKMQSDSLIYLMDEKLQFYFLKEKTAEGDLI